MKKFFLKDKYKLLLEESFRHYEVLKKALSELEKIKPFPLSEEDVKKLKKNIHSLSLLDSIAYRFAKLQESLSKCLRVYLELQGEEVEELFMRDVINLAEKRGFPINWEEWTDIRNLRNILTHEYPYEEDEVAETLNEVKLFMDKFLLLLKSFKREER